MGALDEIRVITSTGMVWRGKVTRTVTRARLLASRVTSMDRR